MNITLKLKRSKVKINAIKENFQSVLFLAWKPNICENSQAKKNVNVKFWLRVREIIPSFEEDENCLND